jgi:hypothetical protein
VRSPASSHDRAVTLFDRYVVVDWSAAATPATGANSIWAADLPLDGSITVTNHPTRADVARWFDVVIRDKGRARVLIAVDAGLGYPGGSAAHLGLGGAPWRALWDEIGRAALDDDHNRNNRFDVAAGLNRRSSSDEGPFWGCPNDGWIPALRRTKPAAFAVGEFRQVEERLRRAGRQPKSVWQLLGAGSVGGQTLTLLPILLNLLDHVDVWPFTTGLRTPDSGHRIVIAEVWPSWFVDEFPAGMIRDAAQVAGTATALRDADLGCILADWFVPAVDDSASVVAEEGWILGVP